MKLNFGPLSAWDAGQLSNFFKTLRGVKKRHGDVLNIPQFVLDIVTPSALWTVFRGRPSTSPNTLCLTQGVRIHDVHATPIPVTGDVVIELDIEYETTSEDADNATDGMVYLKGQPANKSPDADGRIGSSPSPKSTQVGGDHYSKMKIQPIDFITANGIGYIEGNIIKYVCRYKSKNGVEDLKKAQHYLQMLIEQEEPSK